MKLGEVRCRAGLRKDISSRCEGVDGAEFFGLGWSVCRGKGGAWRNIRIESQLGSRQRVA